MRIATRGRYWADEATCQRLEMTSLIDVVFLLLVFFVMTFQVTALEGDFPLDAAPIAEGASPALPVGQTFYVRLTAAQDGALSGVFFGQRPLDGVDVLRQEVRRIVSGHRSRGGAAQDLCVELHCDARLHYQHTIAAMSAVRGEASASGGVVPLIENVRLR